MSKTKFEITQCGLRAGDLVQAALLIGARSISPQLFDEKQRPIRMLVLDIVDEHTVVVLLKGQLHTK
jgi:hypothetical protein